MRLRRTSPPQQLRAYLDRLPELAEDATTSAFWQKQLEGFHRELAEGATLDDLLARLRYGFDPLPPGTRPDKTPRYRRGKDLGKRVHSLARELAKELKAAPLEASEHMPTIWFLRDAGLLDDYLQMCAELGVESTMSVARHYYYARRIVDEFAAPGLLDVLEIGAGAANLAVILERLGRVRSYTIVDLPEMLLAAAATLLRYARDPTLQFGPDGEARFRLLAPSEGMALEGRRFDLALNFNSLSEMDRDVRDGYITLVYRTARPGCLFVNVNRLQRLPLSNGSTWDNNPLLYPYRADDDVIVWEDDPFQMTTRARFMRRQTLAVFRAARTAGKPAS